MGKNSETNQSSEKAIVLLSAGLDSIVSMAMAVNEGFVIELALTVNYGQKAAAKEIEQAQLLAKHFGVSHKVIDVREMMVGIQSGLTTGLVPEVNYADLDTIEITKKTAESVWVPNRNGLLINIAGMFAESMQCSWVITGFNKEEAVTFPDNSTEFVDAINHALSFSTANGVQVKSFTQNMSKADIVKCAMQLSAPLDLAWSCYHGGELMCGVCESCKRLRRAITPYRDVAAIKFANEKLADEVIK